MATNDNTQVRRNAADPRQVKFHERKQRERRRKELEDLKLLIASEPGRRLVWRLLEQCATFASVWDPSGSRMNYLAGRQDFGHFLMAELSEADDEAIYRMMREAKARQKNEELELAAFLTKSVRETDDGND